MNGQVGRSSLPATPPAGPILAPAASGCENPRRSGTTGDLGLRKSSRSTRAIKLLALPTMQPHAINAHRDRAASCIPLAIKEHNVTDQTTRRTPGGFSRSGAPVRTHPGQPMLGSIAILGSGD